MQRGKWLWYLFLVPVLGIGLLVGVAGDNTYQQLRKLEEAYSYITKKYVDPVNPAKLVEDAIEGMLEELDPHSVYISAKEMKRVRENFNASFEGIGIYFEIVEDTIVVLMPITGGPSEKVGLQAGDRIIAINDSSAIGFTNEDVQKHLKGPKGTKVKVTVVRHGFKKPLEFVITRDRIPIYTVDAAYMVDDQTGYIKINRFARTTYAEFVKAVTALKGQGMQRLMLDLRDNPGGYMEMAIRISDEFLPEGARIVYTKSRHPEMNQTFTATGGGLMEEAPVIVLVNERSASASEIVSGALQDHDRALIVGRHTFGKGLVQQQFPLSDGSVLQMTISRYYTPSGRLIQTPYTGGDREAYFKKKQELFSKLNRWVVVDTKEMLKHVPDSLKFRTDHGRVVIGGGGIWPDYIVPADTLSRVAQVVIQKNLDDMFSRWWLDHEGATLKEAWTPERFVREFTVTDELLDAFWRFASRHGVRVEETLPDVGMDEDRLREVFASLDLEESAWPAFRRFVEAHRTSVPDDKQSDEIILSWQEVQEARDVVATRIKAHLARKTWGISWWFPVIHHIDRTFQEAMRLWPSAEALALEATER